MPAYIQVCRRCCSTCGRTQAWERKRKEGREEEEAAAAAAAVAAVCLWREVCSKVSDSMLKTKLEFF